MAQLQKINKNVEIEDEFVPYTEALALKELGFNKPCLYYYYGFKDLQPPIVKDGEPQWINHNDSIFSTCYSAPTLSQAFKFFREKYNKLSGIEHSFKGWYFVIREIGGTTDPMLKTVSDGDFKTYEEAELECLQKLIEICKK